MVRINTTTWLTAKLRGKKGPILPLKEGTGGPLQESVKAENEPYPGNQPLPLARSLSLVLSSPFMLFFLSHTLLHLISHSTHTNTPTFSLNGSACVCRDSGVTGFATGWFNEQCGGADILSRKSRRWPALSLKHTHTLASMTASVHACSMLRWWAKTRNFSSSVSSIIFM